MSDRIEESGKRVVCFEGNGIISKISIDFDELNRMVDQLEELDELYTHQDHEVLVQNKDDFILHVFHKIGPSTNHDGRSFDEAVVKYKIFMIKHLKDAKASSSG